MTIKSDMTRAQAVKELRDMYAAVEECEAKYNRISASQYGYIGRQDQLDDAMSDAGAYSDRIRELEAFLASEPGVAT